ncbi:hypothetical protein GX48_05347 [Paracoccidioides brasiliensis]|nr:hypothetical protein GX48_05347 [Paracoccidioides brasiliensis]
MLWEWLFSSSEKPGATSSSVEFRLSFGASDKQPFGPPFNPIPTSTHDSKNTISKFCGTAGNLASTGMSGSRAYHRLSPNPPHQHHGSKNPHLKILRPCKTAVPSANHGLLSLLSTSDPRGDNASLSDPDLICHSKDELFQHPPITRTIVQRRIDEPTATS